MRLVVAVELTDEIKDLIDLIQDDLSDQGIYGEYAWVDYFPLVDLGRYVDAEKVQEALENMRFMPFDIALNGIDYDNNSWWVDVCKNERIASLKKQIRSTLDDEEISYTYNDIPQRLTMIQDALGESDEIPKYADGRKGISMVVDHLVLVKTHGMRYLDFYPLDIADIIGTP